MIGALWNPGDDRMRTLTWQANPQATAAVSSRREFTGSEVEEKYFELAKKHPDLYDLGRILIQQGCRPDEVRCLKVSDVDLERGQIHIRAGKTKTARRTLDLTAESIEILSRRIASAKTEWIFPSDRKPGHPIVRSSRIHDKVSIDAGVAFVPYDLRHTSSARFIESGGDTASLAQILGHASLRLVQVYCHASAAHKKEAMQKFEAAQQRQKLRIVG